MLNLEQAVAALKTGQVIAYPTEAVFGLGCDPLNAKAVSTIWQLKQRPAGMGLIVVAANWEQLLPYMDALTDDQRALLQASWPGAITWLVPASPTTPAWLTGGRDTIALRMSAHPIVVALCQAYDGALVSTSANLHGHAPVKKDGDAHSLFTGKTGFAGVLAGEVGGADKPTPIRDLQSGQWIRR